MNEGIKSYSLLNTHDMVNYPKSFRSESLGKTFFCKKRNPQIIFFLFPLNSPH